jgi:hypothetical protein
VFKREIVGTSVVFFVGTILGKSNDINVGNSVEEPDCQASCDL